MKYRAKNASLILSLFHALCARFVFYEQIIRQLEHNRIKNPNGHWRQPVKLLTIKAATCLVPVRRFPSPSRSIHFGDVSEANGPRDPKRFGRAE